MINFKSELVIIKDNDGVKMMTEAFMLDLQGQIDEALSGNDFVQNMAQLAEVWAGASRALAINSLSISASIMGKLDK